jgi:NitT/TauT family transport system ATP-binding protein
LLTVTLEDVRFAYGAAPILDGIEMDVEAGSFVCLLGQSGCGKSTLLRLLGGLEKPQFGRLLVEGRPVTGPGLDRGMVFQDYGLFPWMSAGENIAIALKQKYTTMTASERKAVAIERLAEVELDASCYGKLPKELSGGMRQRCAIARAFGIDPPILLMDEPFAALDAVTRARLQDLVLDLWQKERHRRKTIFFVTHDVDEALLLATDIYILGQSPSRIIYRHAFDRDKRMQRDSIYNNSEMVGLRNELIRIINEEIMQLRAAAARTPEAGAGGV